MFQIQLSEKMEVKPQAIIEFKTFTKYGEQPNESMIQVRSQCKTKK